MDDRELLERHFASLAGFYQRFLTAASSPLRFEGVSAIVTPSAGERSLFNAVYSYRDAEALEAALPAIDAAYVEAGVAAWTVWVRPGDRDAAAALERAGHLLDGLPAAMGAGLPLPPPPAGLPEPAPLPIDMATLAALNSDAYGITDGSFERALRGFSEDAVHLYGAGDEGAPHSCVMAYDDPSGDCGIFFVATAADARGRGLAGGLMRRALADAADRGCTSTTLQATKMGEPVYARMGYRRLGTLEMWERRR